MNAFWAALNNPKLESSGIDITQVFGAQGINGTIPLFWVPDLFFPDAINTDLSYSYMRLSPGGNFAWSRLVTMDLLQSTFNYAYYPSDSHTICLSYISYGQSPQNLLQFQKDPAVEFFANYQEQYSFQVNPIWNYVSFSNGVKDITYGGVVRNEAYVLINITRVSTGMVSRLGFPLFLLALLAAFTFWAIPEGYK
eukprot:gene17294-22830_t